MDKLLAFLGRHKIVTIFTLVILVFPVIAALPPTFLVLLIMWLYVIITEITRLGKKKE